MAFERITKIRTEKGECFSISDLADGKLLKRVGRKLEGVDASAPGPHTHPESDVVGLVADLAGKAAAVHTHAESDITGLVADLAAKAAAVHTHLESDVTGLVSDLNTIFASLALKEVAASKGAANGYCGLDGTSKVAIVYLPTGATGTTLCIGNDSRLSDARTPTPHASTHAPGGADLPELHVQKRTPAASYTIGDGYCAISQGRFKLTGSLRLTLAGDSRMAVL